MMINTLFYNYLLLIKHFSNKSVKWLVLLKTYKNYVEAAIFFLMAVSLRGGGGRVLAIKKYRSEEGREGKECRY